MEQYFNRFHLELLYWTLNEFIFYVTSLTQFPEPDNPFVPHDPS